MSIFYPNYEFQYITDKKLRDYLDKYSPGQNKLPLSVMLDMAISGSPNSVAGNWYVNTDLAVDGNGSLGRPFNNLASANAASNFGDTIVILNNAVLTALPIREWRTYDFTNHYIILSGHFSTSGVGLTTLKNLLMRVSYDTTPCIDLESEIQLNCQNVFVYGSGSGQPFVKLNANPEGTSGVSFGCGLVLGSNTSIQLEDDSPAIDCYWGNLELDAELHTQDSSCVIVRRGQVKLLSGCKISNESTTLPAFSQLGGQVFHRGFIENSMEGGGLFQTGNPLPDPATFVPAAGLNDLTASGTFYGTAFTIFRVKIDSTGAPDTFKWSYDNGATWYLSGVDITGGVQPLLNGAQIQFASTTGHNVNDEWVIWASPSGLVVLVEYTSAGLLNDLTVSGNYTGANDSNFVVEIDGNGPDTFKWSNDGGSTWEATTVAITGAAQLLENGVSVTIAATTGHRIGDKWEFDAIINKLQCYMGCYLSSGNGGNAWTKNTANAQALLVPFTGRFDDSFNHDNITLGVGASSTIIGIPPGVTPVLTSGTPGQIGEVIGTGSFIYCGQGAVGWEALL